MPFWWARRRRNWYGPWRKRRYPKRRRRPYYKNRRRRFRRPARRRRRRRRRYKVRRKKQKITIQQWQPDRIVKCKIKGVGYLVAGTEGNQYRCYTDSKLEYGQPKAPGGGGFGVEQFTLEYLYKQWEAHRNIWTKSNDYMDLVRYTGAKISLYRHPTTDFIANFDRQPPFKFTREAYTETHPQSMLLAKHHRVIESVKYNPHGKRKITFRIRPPKQMITKWFFQPDFADTPLFKLSACAANLGYSLYGPNTQSPCLTVYALSTGFYQIHNWGNASLERYLPYQTIPVGTQYKFISVTGKATTVDVHNYADSISFDKGYFQPGVLQAVKVTYNDQPQHYRPIAIGRYNPEEDTGKGNRIWLTSIYSSKAWMQPTDQDLLVGELPLYMAFWGLWDFVVRTKKTSEWLKTTMFVVKSDFIKLITPYEQTVWPILDFTFIQGKMPWDEQFTLQEKNLWYPTCLKQQQVINSFVECGPYVPKYANLPSSTWQLPYKYTLYFKWGGPQVSEQLVQDPKDQEKYPVPDTFQKAIQISDPNKLKCQSFLRSWDFRRGIVKAKALKRMQEHLQTDESDSSDFSETPTKKKKVTSQLPLGDPETEEIQSCLHSLCEESTFPEDPQDLKLLLFQQFQQQQKLKNNLFKLLSHLKKKQAHLQMQTGAL
nr:MAG: ORF1 [Torque teno midi virus]UHK05293.1 MAG: ORF1 [Torque teno midi virus]